MFQTKNKLIFFIRKFSIDQDIQVLLNILKIMLVNTIKCSTFSFHSSPHTPIQIYFKNKQHGFLLEGALKD